MPANNDYEYDDFSDVSAGKSSFKDNFFDFMFLAVLFICAALIVLAVSFKISADRQTENPDSDSAPQTGQVLTEQDIADFDGRGVEKAYLIADFVTQQADGLVHVTYAEIPDHRWADGSLHWGVHYNVFVTKRADLMEPADTEQVLAFVAEVMRLTTKYVIAPEAPEAMTHMGVQLFDADAWTYGGHMRGEITVFEASRENLIAVANNAPPAQWLRAAFVSKQVIYPEASIERLISEYQEMYRILQENGLLPTEEDD